MTIFISAASFEDRCLALPDRLAAASAEDRFLLLDFGGYEDVAPYVFNRARMIKVLKEKGYQPEHLHCRETEPLAVTEEIGHKVSGEGNAVVVFDITAMPRNFILTISRRLASLGISTRFNYNRPKEYGRELSRGVRYIQPVPGYEGEAPANSETILVLILGFEGYKALYARERISPNRVYALFGDPPYEADFLETSRQQNQELLEPSDRVVVDYIHTSNVAAAKRKLQSLYDQVVREYPGSAFVLCPLGTKLQSLACFAFAYQNKAASVVYVSSLNYFTEDYSRGYDENYAEVKMDQLLLG
jgi:hypothetical protein